jgi:hypothetical protein
VSPEEPKVLYKSDKLQEILEKEAEQITNENFELSVKDVLNIKGKYYKVIAVRPNGKATIKPIKEQKK